MLRNILNGMEKHNANVDEESETPYNYDVITSVESAFTDIVKACKFCR